MHYPPHGACWFWDWRLLALHASADLATFLAYATIPWVAFLIYRRTKLSQIPTLFPSLWRWGMAFVGLCGLSHLGATAELWFGGWVYWITGLNKISMAVASFGFVFHFLKSTPRISEIADVLFVAEEEENRREASL
jgi:hypothetical protein